MHECAANFDAMTTVTSLHLTSSEQHTEMRKERQKTDQADISKTLGWIQSHNSFTVPKTLGKSLKSLAPVTIAFCR